MNKAVIKVLALMLAVIMCVGVLAGCSGNADDPTGELTGVPSEKQTEKNTEKPTEAQTEAKTEGQSEKPTEAQTEAKTEGQTEGQTEAKTEGQTEGQTDDPSENTTDVPTEKPTDESSEAPSETPSETMSEAPSEAPSETMSEAPSEAPTIEANEGLKFELDEDTDTYVVKGIGTCTDTDIVIPSTYNGKEVTSIGRYAFSGCSSLTSVVIPNSVTSIGDHAFYKCSSLTNITLPFVGATKDGTENTHFGYIFGASQYANNSKYVPSGLKTVIVTGGTSIGKYAFSGCSSLKSITIPDSVTSIGDDAFYYCTSLEYNIYDNAKYLGNENNPYLVLVEATGEDITSCQIHENTKVIYGSAFYGCSILTSVTIGNSVTSIGSSAFEDCSSLNAVYITDIAAWCGIEFGSYDSNPLSYAHNLYLNGKLVTELVIPDSVTSIGRSAFSGCSNLTSITIPFVGATKGGTENTLFGYIFGASGYYYNDNKDYVPSGLKTVIITGGTSIGYGAFYGCSSLTSVTIPDSVTSIGGSAFYGCSSLASITIPDGVTSIGDWAFEDCSSLTSVTIPDSVTSIGNGAFYYCSSLTNVTIGNSVTSIGDYAFSGCSSLTDINYSGTKAEWAAISKGYQWNDGVDVYGVHCSDGYSAIKE